jgi:hypothetical protein
MTHSAGTDMQPRRSAAAETEVGGEIVGVPQRNSAHADLTSPSRGDIELANPEDRGALTSKNSRHVPRMASTPHAPS